MRLEEREFCLGMRNGEPVGLAPGPAVALDAAAVRDAVDRSTDLAALAAANDMTLGFEFCFPGFCISFGVLDEFWVKVFVCICSYQNVAHWNL